MFKKERVEFFLVWKLFLALSQSILDEIVKVGNFCNSVASMHPFDVVEKLFHLIGYVCQSSILMIYGLVGGGFTSGLVLASSSGSRMGSSSAEGSTFLDF